MNLKNLGTVHGEDYSSTVYERPDGSCFFIADFDIDGDGGANVDNDPYWQKDTTLHFQGKPIDALTVRAFVVPSWFPNSIGPKVLGCQGRVTNLATGVSVTAVVHDLGPKNKDGEGTPYLAEALDLSPNANSGGSDESIFLFECWPGIPANVDGIIYDLQSD